jgi:uncharacterized protein (DUF2267 family)
MQNITKGVKSAKMDDVKKIEKEIQILHIWIKEISYNANWDQASFSLAALRAVLQELRDHLALKDLAHLSAQLPIIIRGIFFENWTPPKSSKSTYEHYLFLKNIEERLNRYPHIEAKSAVSAVFKTLAKHISHGEKEKMRKILPESIEVWWLESM